MCNVFYRQKLSWAIHLSSEHPSESPHHDILQTEVERRSAHESAMRQPILSSWHASSEQKWYGGDAVILVCADEHD